MKTEAEIFKNDKVKCIITDGNHLMISKSDETEKYFPKENSLIHNLIMGIYQESKNSKKIKSSDFAKEYPDFKTKLNQLNLPLFQEQDVELVFIGEERKIVIEFLLNNGHATNAEGNIKRGNFIGNAIVLCSSALGLVEKCIYEDYASVASDDVAKNIINQELDEYFKIIRKYVFWYLDKLGEYGSED